MTTVTVHWFLARNDNCKRDCVQAQDSSNSQEILYFNTWPQISHAGSLIIIFFQNRHCIFCCLST